MEKRKDEDEDLSQTQIISRLTDADYDDSEDGEKEKENLSETQVISKLTDPDAPIYHNEEDDWRRKDDNDKQPSAGHEVFCCIRDLVICMLAVFCVTNFIVRPVRVEGSSMYPTLQDGELGFSNVVGYKVNDLKRFDIAIIYVPEKNEYLVKRVIGLPGETVSYTNGQLYINGEAVDEPFLDQDYVDSYNGTFMDDVEPITLSNDEYYCLGDNRPHSSDSRYYGPFKKENIRSKSVFVIWPLSNFGAE